MICSWLYVRTSPGLKITFGLVGVFHQMTADDQKGMAAPKREDSPQMDKEPSIWHTGTPGEAIQASLSQGKVFLVWIAESSADGDNQWTSIWTHSAIKSILAEHAVCIKLDQGSTDAGMFLQLVNSPPTAEGVWLVFAGQLLDVFPTAPTPDTALQRIQSTITQSENFKQQQLLTSTTPPQPQTPTASVSSPQQDPESQAKNEKIKAQLAARRAKLEAAKVQHGN